MVLMYVLAVALMGLYYYYDVFLRRDKISNIAKKCVFITGCDSGFGCALAQRLDSLGVSVFAGCLTQSGAKELRLRTSNHLVTLLVDVTKTESIQKAFDHVNGHIPKGKEFWAVVNNAGSQGPGGPIEFMNRKNFEEIFQVNIFGPAEVTRIFLPLLKASKGRIVNMAATEGLLAHTQNHPYVSSKFAMVGFSDAIRREKHNWGIKVSTLEARGFRTEMYDYEATKKIKEAQWAALPQPVREEYGEQYLDRVLARRKNLAVNVIKSDLSPVVDAYEHALFSRRPREHYLCGWDTKFYAWLALLPGSMSDMYMKHMVKMPLPRTLIKE